MDGRLLGRPRSYGGNSQEWNAFKFVFKAYVGVIAPPILTAMDRVEPMTDPVQISALPEADKNIARNLSFLLAQVLSGPPLQLMMNIGEQNGLEAWRLLVRSEQPVTGASRIAAMQAILQYKFSPGFDRLEEELRTFEGLVKTYRAIFGEEISDRSHRQSSSRKCLLRSDLIWSCKSSREPLRSPVSCRVRPR